MKRPFILSVSGSVGVGKTTFINNLISYFKDNNKTYYFIEEPVLHKHNRNILNELLVEVNWEKQNHFQLFLLGWKIGIMNLLPNIQDYDFIILDRDWKEDKIFYDMSYINNDMYERLFKAYDEDLKVDLRLIIETPFEIQFKQYKNRLRKEKEIILNDEEISNYLLKVNKIYESFKKKYPNFIEIKNNGKTSFKDDIINVIKEVIQDA